MVTVDLAVIEDVDQISLDSKQQVLEDMKYETHFTTLLMQSNRPRTFPHPHGLSS